MSQAVGPDLPCWMGGEMFTKILVPLDGSDLAEQVLPHALMLADAFDAAVRLLRVVEGPDDLDLTSVTREQSEALRLAEDYLRGAAEYCSVLGVPVDIALAMGSPARQIVREALAIGADLIAMATHGRGGLGRWMIGSVADRVVRAATIPVLVVPARAAARQPGFHRLLVPLDGSALAEAALPHALLLARTFNATVELLSVVPRSDLTAYPESWFPDLEYEALKEQR